jgi:hypothetical protein
MKKFALAATAMAVVSFGLTGCGGSGGQAQPPPLSKSDYQKAVQYADCMRKYGIEVEVPDPNGGPPVGGERTFDPNDPKVAAGRAACGKLAPPAHEQGKPPKELADHALKMAECLRKQGVSAVDPKPGESNVTINESGGDTPEQIRAAFTACNKQIPAPKA